MSGTSSSCAAFATCEACAEKDDWIRRVVDTWEWPKKEVDDVNTEDDDDVGNEDRRPYSGDEMTPEEEVAEEAARMKRMMDELNGGKSKDYTGMDPNRVRLLKKLQSKGLSFMGGENMDIVDFLLGCNLLSRVKQDAKIKRK